MSASLARATPVVCAAGDVAEVSAPGGWGAPRHVPPSIVRVIRTPEPRSSSSRPETPSAARLRFRGGPQPAGVAFGRRGLVRRGAQPTTGTIGTDTFGGDLRGFTEAVGRRGEHHALGVLAMTVGLIRSETGRELRTSLRPEPAAGPVAPSPPPLLVHSACSAPCSAPRSRTSRPLLSSEANSANA
jgi:hypothetical protein